MCFGCGRDNSSEGLKTYCTENTMFLFMFISLIQSQQRLLLACSLRTVRGRETSIIAQQALSLVCFSRRSCHLKNRKLSGSYDYFLCQRAYRTVHAILCDTLESVSFWRTLVKCSFGRDVSPNNHFTKFRCRQWLSSILT